MALLLQHKPPFHVDDLIEGLQDALLTKDEVQMARVFFLILKDQDEIKANINNARKG